MALHIYFLDEAAREHPLSIPRSKHDSFFVFTQDQLEDIQKMIGEGTLREDVQWINCDPPS